MSSSMQVLGLCRWSYPSQVGAFNNKGESLDALREELYAPERLNARLVFLEHLLLPSIRAQSDKDFTLLLMLGDHLPDPWRGKVISLISDVPQIKPVFLPEGQNHKKACLELMQAERDYSAEVIAEFLMDDDDAVEAHFVERLRSVFPKIRPIYKERRRAAIDFCRGFLMRCEDDGSVEYEPVEARLWTPAMALYLSPDHKRSLLNYNHSRVWRSMPVLSINTNPMFVRGAHEGNDSAINRRRVDHYGYDLMKLPDVMAQNFGVDLEQFESAWAAFRAEPSKS